MLAAFVDLVVMVPYSYWRLNGHQLTLTIAYAVEGIGFVTLLGIALYMRRQGR